MGTAIAAIIDITMATMETPFMIWTPLSVVGNVAEVDVLGRFLGVGVDALQLEEETEIADILERIPQAVLKVLHVAFTVAFRELVPVVIEQEQPAAQPVECLHRVLD